MSLSKILIDSGVKSGPWFSKCKEIMEETGDLELAIKHYRNVQPIKLDKENSDLKFINKYYDDQLINDDEIRNTLKKYLETPGTKGVDIHADCSPTGEMPVGCVLYSKNIHPVLASADLHCSVHATYFDTDILVKEIMNIGMKEIHFGPNFEGWIRKEVDEQLIEVLSQCRDFGLKKDDLKKHFATSGDGNHFLNICWSTEHNKYVIVTHWGSRGPGAMLYKAARKLAEKHSKKLCNGIAKETYWLHSDLEQPYMDAMNFLKVWTHLSHKSVHDRIINQVKTSNFEYKVCSYHNTITEYANEYVHLKGSTWFLPQQKGIIPFNFKDGIYIYKNNSNDFLTAPHGAGRDLSRTKFKIGVTKSPEQYFEEQTKGIDFRFWNGAIDISEMSTAYRNANKIIDSVEGHIPDLEIQDRLKVLGVVMAGDTTWKK